MSESLEQALEKLRKQKKLDPWIAEVLLEKGGPQYLPQVVKAFAGEKDQWHRFLYSKSLYRSVPAKYREQSLEQARTMLKEDNCSAYVWDWLTATFDREQCLELAQTLLTDKVVISSYVWDWLMANYDAEIKEDIAGFVSRRKFPNEDEKVSERSPEVRQSTELMNFAGRVYGGDCVPILLAAITSGYREVRLAALSQLVKFNDDHVHDALLQREISRLLQDNGCWLVKNRENWGATSP